jgi:hypothetical protein
VANLPHLSVFIDEAGDPGVRDGLKYLPTRHEWLCVSAVVVRSSRDQEMIEWVKEMRQAANSTQAGTLHYHRIAKERRHAVCDILGRKPAKAFVFTTHKSNMRQYVNKRMEAMVAGGTFYNWCLRLLLERVTAWCETWQRENLGGLEPLRVVFAQRGHDYEHFFSYIDLLRMQKEAGTLFLRGPGLDTALLDRAHWTVKPAEQLAALQLADTVASAFFAAANTASPSFDLEPAKALAPLIPGGKDGRAADVGVTVWPLPYQAQVPEPSRAIFRHFGYRW